MEEMTIKVNEIINWFYSDYKDKLVQVHILKGTMDQCFRKMYALRRSARYDNARRYDFDNATLEDKYKNWERENETIEMFYGCGVVD